MLVKEKRMRAWICLAVIIVLTGCGGAATPTVVPTLTPMAMDEPPLVTPPSAKPYAGGDELLDPMVEAMQGTTLDTLKRQDFYLVTESSAGIEGFYREHYPNYVIDNQLVEPDGTTLTLFITKAGVNGGYLIHIRYLDFGLFGRTDGLLVVTLVRERSFIL